MDKSKTSVNEILRIEIVSSILPFVETRFDSHNFICEFIYRLPTIYANLLIKYDDTTRAHAEIANFLRYNSSKLHIQKIGESVSPDIFGTPSSCALWEKTSI